MNTVLAYTNYIDFDPDYFDPTVERVAFVENVTDTHVTGFRWSYTDKRKLPFRMRLDTFNARYTVSPIQ